MLSEWCDSYIKKWRILEELDILKELKNIKRIKQLGDIIG